MSAFNPKDFEPFSDFVPGQGYLLIRPFPEHVETGEMEPVVVRPIASNIVDTVGNAIESAGKMLDNLTLSGGEVKLKPVEEQKNWERLTIIPRNEKLHRPPGTMLRFNKAVVVAVHGGTYQAGQLVPSQYKPGDVILVDKDVVLHVPFYIHGDKDKIALFVFEHAVHGRFV